MEKTSNSSAPGPLPLQRQNASYVPSGSMRSAPRLIDTISKSISKHETDIPMQASAGCLESRSTNVIGTTTAPSVPLVQRGTTVRRTSPTLAAGTAAPLHASESDLSDSEIEAIQELTSGSQSSASDYSKESDSQSSQLKTQLSSSDTLPDLNTSRHLVRCPKIFRRNIPLEPFTSSTVQQEQARADTSAICASKLNNVFGFLPSVPEGFGTMATTITLLRSSTTSTVIYHSATCCASLKGTSCKCQLKGDSSPGVLQWYTLPPTAIPISGPSQQGRGRGGSLTKVNKRSCTEGSQAVQISLGSHHLSEVPHCDKRSRKL